MGYGILFGKNIVKGKHGILGGIFQHFDYWNNRIFELGTIGFGPGHHIKIAIGKNISTLFRNSYCGGTACGK